jgi:hypothetical protein
MAETLFSRRHAEDESCTGCGTPIKHGVTTQYVDEIGAEICAVCEQPLAAPDGNNA